MSKKAAPEPKKSKSYNLRGKGHYEYGDALLTECENGGIAPVFGNAVIYRYGDLGVWEVVDEDSLIDKLRKFDRLKLDGQTVHLKASDMRQIIWVAQRIASKRSKGFFDDAPPGFAFSDGFIKVSAEGDIELYDHSPSHKARFGYPFDYTDEEPTQFLTALKGMFRDDDDAESKIQLVGEFAGACLLGVATRFQRWLLFRGPGGDGKSTLLEMLAGVFPPGSVCSIRPEDLVDEYSRADLAGKLLNRVTEVSQREILNSETLKAVSAGDQIRGRRIREPPIEFKPVAGHIFSANGFPRFGDSSHGFWRRPIVVTFNRSFSRDPERVLELAPRVLATETRQLVSWLIRRGAEAIQRGGYTIPPSHEKALKEWQGDSDPVFEFIDEVLIATTVGPISYANGWRPTSNLHSAFNDWAEKQGYRFMGRRLFGRRLTDHGYPEVRSHGTRWRPLRLRKDDETKKE